MKKRENEKELVEVVWCCIEILIIICLIGCFMLRSINVGNEHHKVGKNDKIISISDISKNIKKIETIKVTKETKSTNCDFESTMEIELSGKERIKEIPKIDLNDVKLLATLIHAEAGICDEHEKLMVATVTVNRVDHPEFPNTLRKVVFQEGQYVSVGSQAWKEGPSEEELDIARKVLEGYRECPENVVFFSGRCDYGTLYCQTNWHQYASL